MARNVDVAGEILEDHVVSVAEDHPGAVPESVIVVHIVVYVRIQIQAKVVERIPSQKVTIELERGSQRIVGKIGVFLENRGIALVPHVVNIEVKLVMVVINEASMRVWPRYRYYARNSD